MCRGTIYRARGTTFAEATAVKMVEWLSKHRHSDGLSFNYFPVTTFVWSDSFDPNFIFKFFKVSFNSSV
jgi:hypothetical protein